MYAKWTLTTVRYTVIFNSNNGSSVASQTVISGETATKPAAPTKDGYVFAGWYVDSELTDEYDFSSAVTNDMTLYAKWTIAAVTYTITFDTTGGSSISAQVVAENASGVEPDEPTRTGYSFAGWYSDSDLTVAYDFSSAVTSDITLYAKWTVTVPTDISLTNNTGYVSLYTASGNYTLTSSNSLYLSWPSTGASSYTIYINTENDSSTATEATNI